MKKNLDEMTLLLEKNNIKLPEGPRKRENHDRNQPERGHSLMENVLNPRDPLIDSSASNHMVENKESFFIPGL